MVETNPEVKELFDAHTRNFNDLIKAKKIDKVIGRDAEIERLEQILSRRKKNNAILVGPGGVGKTTILYGIAERIVENRCASTLVGKEIIEIDLASIVAGSKFRGDFEQKLKMLVSEIIKNGKIIAFIDEIHTLVGSGASSNETSDGANILKPYLTDGTFQLVGATTDKEYNKTIGKDSALERRFQKIQVVEPSKKDTLKIITKLQDYFGDYHKVSYSPEVLEEIVELTDRYMTNRYQPDKSIDVMDEVGSRIKIARSRGNNNDDIVALEEEYERVLETKEEAVRNQCYALAEELLGRELNLKMRLDAEKAKNKNKAKSVIKTKVTIDNIHEIVSFMSNIPKSNISNQGNVKEEMIRLQNHLKSNVIGQDDAVDNIVKHIQKTKLGLKKDDKPASFLFLGSSGCGKTLLSKELTLQLLGTKKRLVRINMNEYQHKHNVSRLIGSPPGYVGYGNGGELTNAIKDNPFSVLLFDEIEKAHPDVLDILLQLLDEGILTDAEGVTYNFRNCIVIMTSNIGTRKLKDFGQGIGFQDESSKNAFESKQKTKALLMKELEKTLKPEVINRLGNIVVFNELNKENLYQILDLSINDLNNRLKDIGYTMELSDDMKNEIIRKSDNSVYGARLIERIFNNMVEDKVTEMLLDEPEKGSVLKVNFVNEESVVTV